MARDVALLVLTFFLRKFAINWITDLSVKLFNAKLILI